MAKKPKANDTSLKVHQRDKLDITLEIGRFDWTEKQKQIIETALAKETQIVFIKGPAGTSKTTLAVYCALQLLNDKKVSDITFVRSIVEASQKGIGFLKGDIHDKINPYMTPFYDKMDMFIGMAQTKELEKQGRAKCTPIGFIRGEDWNAKCIIFEEMQNATLEEATLFLTRIGRFCKVFCIGDPLQSDIRNGSFVGLYNMFNTEQAKATGIHCFEFGEEDIMRSDLCRFIVKTLGEYNNRDVYRPGIK